MRCRRHNIVGLWLVTMLAWLLPSASAATGQADGPPTLVGTIVAGPEAAASTDSTAAASPSHNSANESRTESSDSIDGISTRGSRVVNYRSHVDPNLAVLGEARPSIPHESTAEDGSIIPVQFVPQQLPPLQFRPPPPLPQTAQVSLPPPPSIDLVGLERTISGTAATVRATTDAGDLLFKSPAAFGLVPTRRTPIIHAPVSRGKRLGQITASGSYWFPARQDLDTMLSKIDSRVVRDMIVIKGPYSVQYGPGFDFIDAQLLEAPRYEDGYEAHASTGIEYKTNGAQWLGRTSMWGGSTDWGFRVGYGHRTGSDYETGARFTLPTSYKSRLPDFAFAVDLSDDDHLDFHYLRLDQTDVEFPGQFYDINFLVTDAYELRYVRENHQWVDRLMLEGWYNGTRFEGDTSRLGKQRQIPLLTANDVQSETAVNSSSAGYRLAATWGKSDTQLTAGSDLRALKQMLIEDTREGGVRQPYALIPPARSVDPGLFLETSLGITDRLAMTVGGRVDWVSTNAVTHFNRDRVGDPEDLELFLRGEFDREFQLWAAYVTAEFRLAERHTVTGGFGSAMRPPTMTELYSVEPFVAVLPQLAYTTLYGNPNLDAERLRQIDVGVTSDYDWVRGGINGFYAWIDDYVTLDLLLPPTPDDETFTSAYSFVNTEHATLSGFETYGECDVSDHLTAFATVAFVEGRDHTRSHPRAPVCSNRNLILAGCVPGAPRSGDPTPEEPLPVIPPLQSRMGLRIHAPHEDPCWAVEVAVRVVDNQDRVATSLIEQPTAGFATYSVQGYWQAFDDLLITTGIENLTDRFYREHFDSRLGLSVPVYQPGQNFYLGLELTR